MVKRIFINKHAVQGFLIQYKQKHHLNNTKLERMTGVCNATFSNLCYAKQDSLSQNTYNKLRNFIPDYVLDMPIKGKVTREEVQRAEKEGFTQTYIATVNNLEDADTVRRKDVDSIAWGVTVLEEYARKAESRHVILLEDIGLLSEQLKKIHYTLNNRTLWQRIKNKFRKNTWTEKTSINVDENSQKK